MLRLRHPTRREFLATGAGSIAGTALLSAGSCSRSSDETLPRTDRSVESIDGSLSRLQLDAVDIFYLPSVNVPQTALHEPYLRAFETLKRSGKTRFVGITTHAREPEVIGAAAGSGFWDVVLTAYNFRQSHREEVRAAIRQAAEAGLGVVAMKTQAGVYWNWTRTRKINMKAALKWVLQDENVHTSIPAFSNFDEMRETLSVMKDLSMSAEEERDLRVGAVLGLPGLYCQQCARCAAGPRRTLPAQAAIGAASAARSSSMCDRERSTWRACSIRRRASGPLEVNVTTGLISR